MHPIRSIAPGAVLLVLAIVLAACGQVAANPPTATPAPTPTAVPSEEPAVDPTPMPTVAPTAPPATPDPTPVPTPAPAVAFDLPMMARSTADGVNVRSLPSIDAPLITGETFDLSSVRDVRLTSGELVFVTMGPVMADGIAWYEVSAADGGDLYWHDGWVASEYLVRHGDVPSYNPVVVDLHGVGSGSAASAEVTLGTPLTARFAATPMDGRDSCEIEVTVIGTDGLALNVATESLSGPKVAQKSASELPSLWQEDAGAVTIQVKTDCSFAASLIMPQA